MVELVKIRASQINGCAFCLHMHAGAARKQGETEERLYLLDAWRESPLYSERERAALGWTEALTLLPETHAPDGAYKALRAHFNVRYGFINGLPGFVTIEQDDTLQTTARDRGWQDRCALRDAQSGQAAASRWRRRP
jgi:AhpD family alkylhydroperoxidase